MTKNLGLYIHVPFCRSRCQYCGFYSVCTEGKEDYLRALEDELSRRAPLFEGRQCDTVYLGGGTPSTLSAVGIQQLMDGVRAHFTLAEQAEITMEMNPCDMEEEYLLAVKASGINRLSVGVQSMDDRLLRAIGRLHTAAQAEKAVRRAYKLGFHNISIDLMYDLPLQSPDNFISSLKKAAHLPITHMSIYSLIIEEGTPFAFQCQKGRLPRPTEGDSWSMYQAMCRIPPHYGFHRYEISSFARKGYESKHNGKYWRMDDYLGVGPAACSRIGQERWANAADLKGYEAVLLSGKDCPREVKRLTEAEDMEEYCFLHLRMTEGMDRQAFAVRYGDGPEKWYKKELAYLKENQLINEENGHIALTKRGQALGNFVFEQFLRSV